MASKVLPPPGEKSDEQWLPQYICNLQSTSILEVSCSSGRVYRQLQSQGYLRNYSGVEIADYVIQQNQFMDCDPVRLRKKCKIFNEKMWHSGS
jgi:hypothetical protein